MSADTCPTGMLSLGSKAAAKEKGDDSSTVSTSSKKGCLTFRLIMGKSGTVRNVYGPGDHLKDKLTGKKMTIAEQRLTTRPENPSGKPDVHPVKQEIVRVPLPPGFEHKVQMSTPTSKVPSVSMTAVTLSTSLPSSTSSSVTSNAFTLPPSILTQTLAAPKTSFVKLKAPLGTAVASATFPGKLPTFLTNLPSVITEPLTIVSTGTFVLKNATPIVGSSSMSSGTVLSSATPDPKIPETVAKIPEMVAKIPEMVAKMSTTTTKQSKKSAAQKAEAEGQPGAPRVFPKTKKHSRYRHSQRLRMRPWLLMLLNSGEVPGLQWVKQEEKIFSIPWKHASGRTWKGQDADLFERYALHTGKHSVGGQADHKRWKANFRCALNSLNDVEELQDRSMKTGEFAYKLYRFLEPDEKKILKKGKLVDRRMSDSSGGEAEELSEDQNTSDLGNHGNSTAPKQSETETTKSSDKSAQSAPRPPEIKDHNYSTKYTNSAGVTLNECVRVIDAEEVIRLLQNKSVKKEPDDVGEEHDLFNHESDGFSVLYERSSVDDTIDAVIQGSRVFNDAVEDVTQRRIKSELIIDDIAARFVSNVMEIDTTSNHLTNKEIRERIASAQSLAALSGLSMADQAEEESNVAANILLDLSRMKQRRDMRKRGLQESDEDSIASETMEEEAVEDPLAESDDADGNHEQPGNISWEDSSGDEIATDAGTSGGSSVGVLEESRTIVLPLDLRIKSEPMDESYDAYENYSFDPSVSAALGSSANVVYRSRREQSDTDEEEEPSMEHVPPPAHSFSPLNRSNTDDLPQPLDLSVKVHNLMIVDSRDSSPQNKGLPHQGTHTEVTEARFAGDLAPQSESEPLDLKVKKAHVKPAFTLATSQLSSDAMSLTGTSALDQSEPAVLPLDLSIVKSEPMDDSYESFSDRAEERPSLGPVPELIRAPSEEMVLEQPAVKQEEEQEQEPQDYTVHVPVEADKTKSPNSEVPIPIALFVNEIGKNQILYPKGAPPSPEKLKGCEKGRQPIQSSVSASAPTIKSLLQRKRPLAPACVLCDKTFFNHKQLSNHMLVVHTHDATDVNLAKKTLFQCTVCMKLFKEGGRLKRHMKSHRATAKVRCSECRELFENREKYLEHAEKCSPAGFRCNSCGQVFSEKSQHMEHMAANHSETVFLVRPYQCAICNTAFEHCDLLQEHMERHRTSGVTVSCARCFKLFKSGHIDAARWSSLCQECDSGVARETPSAPHTQKQNLSGMSVLLQAVERTVKGSLKE